MTQEEIIDWDRVELDYRSGIKSLRQIGAENNITEGAIRKRAKRDSWERDLSGKIKAKTEQLVRKEAVRSEVREKQKLTENVVVEANAMMQADIILAHRKDIQRYRGLAAGLLSEIEQTSSNQDLFERLAELLHDPEAGGDKKAAEAQAKRLEVFYKVLSIPGRVDSFKKLADTLKVLVALEREAFGIDERKGNDAQVTYNMQF